MEENINATQEQLEIENMSDETLANIVSEGLKYTPIKDILVKPLDPIKIVKTTNVPVETGEVDEEGEKLMEMQQKDIEVESVFREGVIISLPIGVAFDASFEVGMKIVYNHKFSIPFDLFKDSVLVKPYDVIAKVK
jgi:hypothetical protein